MLENGEYPSFAEISYFSSEGHDFAIYEQSIIIPKMFGYSAEIWNIKLMHINTNENNW